MLFRSDANAEKRGANADKTESRHVNNAGTKDAHAGRKQDKQDATRANRHAHSVNRHD